MFLSIIIPAFNEEKHLPITITRVRQAMECQLIDKSDWEMIVCDNNSDDRTNEIASELGVKVVREPVNQISLARNTGAKTANGEWLLFIDADTYPSANTMKDVLDLTKNKKFVGGGSTVKVDDSENSRLEPLHWVTWFFHKMGLCGGAFLFCRKKAFEAVGGFSQEIYVYEDVDFIKRLKNYGKSRGQKFKVLRSHPVSTSGRKSNNNLLSLFRFFYSALIGYVIYLLHFILPSRNIRAISKRTLSYWYSENRD